MTNPTPGLAVVAKDPPEGTIRKVLKSETHLITEHFLRLDRESRRKRFSHDVSESFVRSYAAHAADFGNLSFGYFVDGEIHALAELRRAPFDATAEAAFSVEPAYANRGVGTALMGYIIRAARNRGTRHLVLICLADNTKMKAIARHYGAELTFEDGSYTADIVPKTPDYMSLFGELVEDRMAYLYAAIDLQKRFTNIALANKPRIAA